MDSARTATSQGDDCSSSRTTRSRSGVTSVNASEKTPGDVASRRKACNQCKQQKLRCEYVSYESRDQMQIRCRRCHRLDLECKIEEGFRRTRKRRRSADLEDEIHELKRQLNEAQTRSLAISHASSGEEAVAEWTMTTEMNRRHLDSSSNNTIIAYQDDSTLQVAPLSGSIDAIESPGGDTITTEQSRAPGLTTRPEIDQQTPRRLPRGSFNVPRPRVLGNAVLSVEEIEDLFQIFKTYYHPFLPLIDTMRTPHEYYELSGLLFWVIISIAARRLKSQPTLLPKLARKVTDLLWRTVRTTPYSVYVVQAIALLCTWPFPTSSSTSDPTFVLTGLMIQMGVQMGLNRPVDAQDFSKAPLELTDTELAEWTRTWEACMIISQSATIGCGLQTPLRQYGSDISQGDGIRNNIESAVDNANFRYNLMIETFRSRVTMALMDQPRDARHQPATRERLILYRLLNKEITEIEGKNLNISNATGQYNTQFQGPQLTYRIEVKKWHSTAARLHLHAFYLFDHASSEGYEERICALYVTASSLIDSSRMLDEREVQFFDYCPFFCYQIFVCASMIVLRIASNGHFRSLVDTTEGMKLVEASIAALRKMSVVNNDLPARLGDVIGFFCALPDPTKIGGTSVEDIQLKQVRNRLSVSVVHDCLVTWRRHFMAETEGSAQRQQGGGLSASSFRTPVGDSPYLGGLSSIGDAQNMFGLDFSFDNWDFSV
ncbi:zn 2cys6 transcriptional activator [Colletotrichum chrysophilum]|uniref:Zn 2cys6 transcriptional activator n=1 Tax=Colletotrichum chrysophilum TaxID=1836956 RepID=A0AAD9AI18_9PEZI|nr:zn 2cys6 transcriptional activator [Colletotrichum chrysophilum]